MYLLARAQASERPPARRAGHAPASRRDGRAFRCSHQRRLRSHAAAAGWPDVSARIEGLSHPASPPTAASSTARHPGPDPGPDPADRPIPAPSASRSPITSPSPPTPEGSRFSTRVLRSADSPTTRSRADSLFGDRLGRKLIVVGEGSNHAVDFVRADSAGFRRHRGDRDRRQAWRSLGGQRCGSPTARPRCTSCSWFPAVP